MTNAMSKREYEVEVRRQSDFYRKHIKIPTNIKKPHLDHIIPIDIGYRYNIPVHVMSDPINLAYKESGDNLSKGNALGEEVIKKLNEMREHGMIDISLGETASQELAEYSLDRVFEAFKNPRIRRFTIDNVPTSIAINFDAVFCQRNEELRFEKTVKAIGEEYLDTHAIMMCAVYPDNSIKRLDGSTRSYIFRNNLQHPNYDVPEDFTVIFIKAEDNRKAEKLYHSLDSSATSESFADKVSGYFRNRYGNDLMYANLPIKWRKGESVYDIAVVALDGIADIEINNPEGDKAAKTTQNIDLFMDEFVTVGLMLNQKIRKELTAPLLGTMMSLLKRDKSDKMITGIKTVVDQINYGYIPWSRTPINHYTEEKNLYIMLDELQTSDSINNTPNPFLKNNSDSSRRIIPDMATKTTKNHVDRALYCGWIVYCFGKYIRGEHMSEDIIFDVTGVVITDQSSKDEYQRTINLARSKLIQEYKKFCAAKK